MEIARPAKRYGDVIELRGIKVIAAPPNRGISSRLYEEAFDYVDAPIRRVAQKEVPLPYNRNLEQMAIPQVEDVIKAVKEVL